MSKEQLVIELNKMRDNFLQESDDTVILFELLVNYIDNNSDLDFDDDEQYSEAIALAESVTKKQIKFNKAVDI